MQNSEFLHTILAALHPDRIKPEIGFQHVSYKAPNSARARAYTYFGYHGRGVSFIKD